MTPKLTTVHWGKFRDYVTATIRDNEGRTVPIVTDYLDHLVEKHFKERRTRSAAKSEMEPTVHVLNSLTRFLLREQISLAAFDDSVFMRFRDAQLEEVKANPINRGLNRPDFRGGYLV